MILALDTTGAHGSIALARSDGLVDQMELHAPDGYSHVLFGYVEELLRRNRVRLADVDCFAAASGPGSFTGVRVGLACVKGLAEAMSKPAVGISNLLAIASFGTAELRAAVMDARRGDVYAAVYDASGELVKPETVTKFSVWVENLPVGDVEILSPDLEFAGVAITRTPPAIAAAVARLAIESLARGNAGDAANLDANYVRRSDAELFWRDAQ